MTKNAADIDGSTANCRRRVRRRLIHRRVVRHPRDELEDTALAAQYGAPEPVGVVREDVIGYRRLDDPVVPLELRLELAAAPAGVAGEDAPPAHGGRVRILVEGQEPEVGEDRDRRLL